MFVVANLCPRKEICLPWRNFAATTFRHDQNNRSGTRASKPVFAHDDAAAPRADRHPVRPAGPEDLAALLAAADDQDRLRRGGEPDERPCPRGVFFVI